MPRYALDDSNTLVIAKQAVRGRNYRCRECKGTVRLRSSGSRQPHFFHLAFDRRCGSSGKGLIHLLVQEAIAERLPKGEAVLEQPFPQVNRIADVCWPTHKLIFEVQCSGITGEEILARNSDYRSQGYTVVWILHTDRYGSLKTTEAERVLQGHTHYYTDINADGTGSIFDSAQATADGIRWTGSTRLHVDLSHPIAGTLIPHQGIRAPVLTRRRMAFGGICFAGDLLDRIAVKNDEEIVAEQRAVERRARRSKKGRLRKFLDAMILRPYRIVLYILLERASR